MKKVRRSRWVAGSAIGMVMLVALGAGCAGVPVPPSVETTRTDEGSELVVIADWNDVPAAAQTGASHAEMALSSEEVHPDRLSFAVRTASAESGILTATRIGPSDEAADQPSRIRLLARIGRFGNPQAERRLLAFISQRLEQLRGVDWAPIR